MNIGNEEGKQMMRKVTAMNPGAPIKRMAGVLLLDVVLGIVIFVVGMLALTHLQGNLTRSGADANTRTVAANIAEEIIEAARAFEQIPTDSGGLIPAYNDIVTQTQTVTRGGIEYTVNITVDDYYYAAGSFSTTKPDTIVYSDLKYMQVEVQWNRADSGLQFQISEGQTTGDLLGSGSITLTDVISSLSAFASVKVGAVSDGIETYAPDAEYTPGYAPDVAALDLGGNDRFKETSTPATKRKKGRTETWFDVTTYQQVGSDAIFLRREETVTVSCRCLLHEATADSGRRPTVWDGAVYSEGEFVAKTWGESPSTGKPQSSFCLQCCRDHHDGGAAAANDQLLDPGRSLYNPFKSSSDYHSTGTFAGDHKHYSRNDLGELFVVETTVEEQNEYLEACRLVRKDGFFRVAQDFRREGLFAFPEDYLDSDSDISEYSGYVGDAATAFVAAVGTTHYENNPPTLLEPAAATPSVTFPASTYYNATSLPNVKGSNSQQLRSRGIYIDYLSHDLRVVINCLEEGLLSAEECGADNVFSPLEVIPFFDVQVTALARWNEIPINTPLDVTNEAILEDNAHSRGLATRDPSGNGMAGIETNIHKGNIGITGTDSIIPADYGEFTDSYMYVTSPSEPDAAPVEDSVVVSGLFLAGKNDRDVADLLVSGSEARCTQTNSEYACAIDAGAVNPTITISDYRSSAKRKETVCSDTLIVDEYGGTYTRFILPITTTSDANIVFDELPCPTL